MTSFIKTSSTVLWVFFGLAVMTAGCSPPSPRGTGNDILVTTSHLEDIVSRVAGSQWKVRSLVPRGADPHVFEPSADSLKVVSQARLMFSVGAGLEGWAGQLVENSQHPELKVVELSKGLPLQRRVSPGGHGGWLDPHIWMSPQLVAATIDKIVVELETLDPEGGPRYRKNAEDYKQELESLDLECQAMFDKIPLERRKIVTSHDALGYMADRYELEVIATVIPHVSTEAAETSAKDFQALSALIRESGVEAIFADQNENPKLFEQLARESGIRVVPELLLDTLGPEGSETGTYLGCYRHNVQTILETLR